jgi:hypothetical protein
MGRGRRVCVAVLALGFFPFAVSLSLAFTVAVVLALPFSPCHIVLMEGAMTLLVDIAVAVAVEAAAAMQRLVIHGYLVAA